MTSHPQLTLAVVIAQPTRRPSPRRPPADRRRDRARARLLVDAARVLPWPRDVVRDVVLGGTLLESLEALHVIDEELRELERRARLLEDERQ